MASPGASQSKGKARGSGGSLRRAFVVAAGLTAIPFLLLIAYLVWGNLSRENSRVEREAFAQASLLSAQVEKHFGARIEALSGAANLVGASGGSPAVAETQGRRIKQAFPPARRALAGDRWFAGGRVPDAGRHHDGEFVLAFQEGRRPARGPAYESLRPVCPRQRSERALGEGTVPG